MFTETLAAANNSRTRGRPIDTYDRGYNRGSGCNEGTDYEALHLARRVTPRSQPARLLLPRRDDDRVAEQLPRTL